MSWGKPQRWRDMNQDRRKCISVHVMGETSWMTGHEPRQEKTVFCPYHGGNLKDDGIWTKTGENVFLCHEGNIKKDDGTWTKTGENVFLCHEGNIKKDDGTWTKTGENIFLSILGGNFKDDGTWSWTKTGENIFLSILGGNLKDDGTWTKTGENIFLSMSWGKPQRWRDMNQDRRKHLSVHVMGETSKMMGHEPRQEKMYFCSCHGGNLMDDGTWTKTGEDSFLSISWGKPQGWHDMVMKQDKRKWFSCCWCLTCRSVFILFMCIF